MHHANPTHQLERLDSLQSEDATIERALDILSCRLRHGDTLTNPSAVQQFLRLQAAGLTHEVFGVMFLDIQNRLMAYEPMFRGTLSETSVYPREIARRALQLNAASVILHHNHPGGSLAPSVSDQAITAFTRSALELVDVRVLDHVITSDEGSSSMAELGLMQRG